MYSDNNDILQFFNDSILRNNNDNNDIEKWDDEDELNYLWKQYNNFVQELKSDGYKVMRNDDGKHKIIKL